MKRKLTITLEQAREWYSKGGDLKDVALSVFTEEELCKKKKQWIDLGLPSGKLWASENEEGYYTWNRACEKFGDNLPKLTDFAELYDYCKWEWDTKKKGMNVIGSNGNSIFLPASGYRNFNDGSLDDVGSGGYFWSASPNSNYAYYLNFNYNGFVYPSNYYGRAFGQSVRCLQESK